MKSTSSLQNFFKRKLTLLAALFLSALPLMAASPVITGTFNTISINDTQSTNIFNGAVITDTNSTVESVIVSYSPTNLGDFLPLPAGVTISSLTNYVIVQTNTVDARDILRSLTFNPNQDFISVPKSSNIVFRVTVSNTNSQSTFTNTTVTLSSTNDAPTMINTVTSTFNVNDTNTVKPFVHISITDPDNRGLQSQIVTITMDDTNKGTILVGSTGFVGNSNGVYSITNTPAAVTAAISNLVYSPTPNRVPVGQSETNGFTIVDSDGFASPITITSIQAVSTSINDNPTLTGVSGTHATVLTGTSVNIFSALNIGDVDTNETETVSVTLNGPAPQGNLQVGSGSGGINYQNNFTASGDPNTVAAALRSLTYRASSAAISGTNTMTFAIVVTDANGGSVSNTVSADVYSLASAPTLIGTQSGLRVNDNTTIAPFSTVTIQTFNGSSATLVISLAGGVTNETKGQLVNLSGFVKNNGFNPPTYTFTGTADAATAAIRSLLFQPTPNRINGSTNDTTFFAVTLSDSTFTNATDLTTSVIVTPVNDAPTIAGISPLVTIQDNQSVAPFTTLLIADVDESGFQPVTVTVTLDDPAKGTFSTNSLAASGFTNISGSYSFSSTNVNNAVRQLVFVPTAGRIPVGLTETTTFNVSVDDHHGGLVVNSGTLVRVVAVSGLPVINLPPQPLSLPIASNNFPFQAVSINGAGTLGIGVTISNTTQGSFTAASLTASGFTNHGGGLYIFGGTSNALTTAIQALNFTPNSGLPLGTVINFTIGVTNQTPNFTVVNFALTFRQTSRSFIVSKLDDYDPSNTNNIVGGSLRKAIADAGPNDHITFDIRSTNSGVSDYPAVIRLKSPLVLNNNLIFDGPGADNLTISGDTDGNGSPDVQLFVVNAFVTFNRLSLASGYASFAGGAAEVTTNGTLNMSFCAVSNCVADVWGGAIDISGGTLNLDHCLIRSNKVSAALGQGGGGISIYSTKTCTISTTTFSTNQQQALNGLGGGALYVENVDPGAELDVYVLNCTFAQNADYAGHGSSIRPNVFNTFVQVQNSIFADASGKNLEMDQSGSIVSLGGNISDDATSTTFSIGGAPVNTLIFGAQNDLVNDNVHLAPLGFNGGPTMTYALPSGSDAVNNGLATSPASSVLGTDQRGLLILGGQPDSGAFERGATNRFIIEEVFFNPPAPTTNNEFIEFYVPRDSGNVNFAGYKIYTGNTLRHTITNTVLQPGQALVVFSHSSTAVSVPGGVFKEIASGELQMDNSADTIVIQNPAGQTVYQAGYVGSFTSSASGDPGFLTASNQSVVLSPQFKGDFLPYQRVVAKEGGRTPGPTEYSNAGNDATGTPLAIGNAPPVAFNDSIATDAQTALTNVLALANDLEPDSTDTIRIVGVGVTNGVTPGVTGTNSFSTLGASIKINPLGGSLSYDPTASATLRALAPGATLIDTFQYTILDSNSSGDHNRGANLSETNANLAKATATISVTVTGVNFAPVPVADGTNTNIRLTTAEDTVLDFNTVNTIVNNDTDPNSDDNTNTLNVIAIETVPSYVSNSVQITTALGATVTLDIRFDRNQTHITYDPRASTMLNALPQGQSTVDSFYYSIIDSHGAIGTAAVNITVTGVNDAPTANPDAFATDEDTTVTVPAVTLLANDTDPDTGTVLQIISVQTNSLYGASVQIVGTNIVYNPTVSSNLNALARKEIAVDTFNYTLTDDHGLPSTTTVTVTVTGVNDHPISSPDFYTTDEDTKLTVGGSGVLANDIDPDVNGIAPDDVMRVTPFTNYVTAAGATVTLNPNGSFSYDPRGVFDWLKLGETTNDSFSYVVMDHSQTIANDDAYAIQGGSSGNVLKVLANDVILSQISGAVLSIANVGTPNQGGVVSISAGTLVYTPSANFVGTETFTYTISDGLGGTDTATVTAVVNANKLFANPDTFTAAKGTTITLDVLNNDLIIPSSPASLTVTAVGTPNNGGTVFVNGAGANNNVGYTPNPTNTTPFYETFTYVASASTGIQATGTVTVLVIDRSNTLTANDDTFTVAAGSGNNVLDVLVNDLIMPGSNTNLHIIAVQTNGLSGTVFINNAQTRLVYKPAAGLTNHLEPFINYTISDGAGGTATGSVSIKVQPSGFFANSDVFTVTKNNANNVLTVLANDVELPNVGQVLFISDVGIGTNAPNHGGTISVNSAGTGVIYTPASNYFGDELFTYEISDGTTARAVGQVRVKVIDIATVNSNPDTYQVARDSTNNLLAVLKNDYIYPNVSLPLSITGLVTNSVLGKVSFSAGTINNLLVYSPKPGFIGTEIFQYLAADTDGNRATNVVTVTVGTMYVQNDQFAVLSGSTNNVLSVLNNDLLLPDTNGVRVVSNLGATDHGGTVVISPTGNHVHYSPLPGFIGAEHFTYTMTNDTGAPITGNVTVSVLQQGADRETNTVTLTIIGVNDIPTIANVTGGWNITDKQTVQPFTNITIADLDEYGQQLQNVTVKLDNAIKGTLQNLGGFVSTGGGVYFIQDTPSAVSTALRGLVFVPTENRITVPTTETTTFTVSVDDSYVSSPVTNNQTTVNVTSVNDASTIAGTVGGFNITDKQTVTPFTSVVIADVDNLTIQPLTVTVSLDLAAKGLLQTLGGFVSSGSGVYTMTGTASNITASIHGLVFVPTENRITVPTNETTTLTIAVNDSFVANPVTDNVTTISVTAVNDASTIAGVIGGWNITDKQTVQPFTNVVVADVDDLTVQPLTVTLRLDDSAKGILTNLSVFTNASPGRYRYTGTASNATAAIRAITFVPTENRITVPTNETTTIALFVNDGFVPTAISNNLTTINVTSVNDAPTITGAIAAQAVTDKQTIRAFTNVTVGDVDNLGIQPLTVFVSMDNSAKGMLQNLGAFSLVTPGIYTMSGTPAVITANLRNLIFIPTENRILVPNTETNTFTITANDSFATVVTNATTTVVVTPVDDAPVITGTQANQRAYDHASLHPFSGVNVTDVDSFGSQVVNVTVSQDLPTHGFFTSLGSFVSSGGGVYTLTNVTPAQATAGLRALIFVPTIVVARLSPGTADTNRLTIAVSDTFVAPVVDTNTTVLAMDAYAKKLTATNGLNSTTFASSLAATTNYVVAGMPNDAGAIAKAGSAYIYSRNAAGPETWTQIKKLVGVESPTATDQFGLSVGISGDTVVSGAPNTGTGTGVAYIFDRNVGGVNNWGQAKKLVPTGGLSGDLFGTVAINNDTIAVGAPRSGAVNAKMGAVYIYDRNQGGTTNWGQTKKLIPGDGADSDAYGVSVALNGDTLAVGAQFNSATTNAGFRSGTVYVYDRNTGGSNNWGLVKKIVGTDSVNNDQFGHAVAVNGDMIVVGAPNVTTNSQKSGAAYVFVRNQGGTNNWGQAKKLNTTDNVQGAQFGVSVAVDYENIAVGIVQSTTNGGAYLFVRNSPGLAQWSLLEKFTPPTGDITANYGSSVAMGGNILAANAAFNDGANWLGLTYIYRLKFDGFYMANTIPDQTAITGSPFSFALPASTFVDSDGDIISYTATNMPSWMTFDTNTLTFSGTPTATSTNTITVSATEVDGSSGSTQFHLIVRSLSELYFGSALTTSGTNKVALFQLNSVPGLTYRLQRSPVLGSAAVWTDVATAAAASNQVIMTFGDTNAPIPSFYRIKTP